MSERLEQELAAANERASRAMVNHRRLRAWFEQYPNHPSRQRSLWEAEQDEREALDDYVRLRNQQQRAREHAQSEVS